MTQVVHTLLFVSLLPLDNSHFNKLYESKNMKTLGFVGIVIIAIVLCIKLAVNSNEDKKLEGIIWNKQYTEDEARKRAALFLNVKVTFNADGTVTYSNSPEWSDARSNLVDNKSKAEYSKGDRPHGNQEGSSSANDSPELWDCYDVDLNNGVFWAD